MKGNARLPLVRLLFVAWMWTLITACNDLATDIGADIVPGTDTIYALSSVTHPILDSVQSRTKAIPLYNTVYVLFGKTNDSEARLFLEFVNYPQLGDPSEWEVLESHLQLIPQEYRYGDTTSSTVSVRGYNLSREWSIGSTWDSIWAPDGSTTYYSTSTEPVCDATEQVVASDSVLNIPMSLSETRRWLIVGADSTRRVHELFGIVLLPNGEHGIRQFRNIQSNNQLMRLRVITKHKDSSNADTTFIQSAVGTFVKAPPALSTDLVVQGTQVHYGSMRISLDSLPEYAVIVGAALTVTLDYARSHVGTGGPDELLELRYTPPSGSMLRFQSRINANGEYVFPNISAIAQRIRATKQPGTIELYPSDSYETWRLNRLSFHSSFTDPAKQPLLTVLFTVPTVFQ